MSVQYHAKALHKQSFVFGASVLRLLSKHVSRPLTFFVFLSDSHLTLPAPLCGGHSHTLSQDVVALEKFIRASTRLQSEATAAFNQVRTLAFTFCVTHDMQDVPCHQSSLLALIFSLVFCLFPVSPNPSYVPSVLVGIAAKYPPDAHPNMPFASLVLTYMIACCRFCDGLVNFSSHSPL